VTGAAVQQAAQYVSQRHQFGRPLLSFGHVAAQVAALQAAATGSARAVHSLAVELSAASASASAAKRAAVVAIAATQAAIQVTGDVIQLHGGYGYIADYPCERWFRDCVSLRAVLSASLPGRPRPPAWAYPQLAATTAAS
jgi:alkylation response protein AidB-like acyl-CoA dehydrogenase